MHIFCKKLRQYRYVHVGEFPRLAQRHKDRWSPFYRPWRMAEEEGGGDAHTKSAPLLFYTFPKPSYGDYCTVAARRSRVSTQNGAAGMGSIKDCI